MLEVTIQQCEDMKYIRIAERIRSYIANAPQMIVTSVCGAFLYPITSQHCLEAALSVSSNNQYQLNTVAGL